MFDLITSCGGMLLTQTKYMKDLLIRTKMVDANGVPTPMLSQYKLRKHDS